MVEKVPPPPPAVVLEPLVLSDDDGEGLVFLEKAPKGLRGVAGSEKRKRARQTSLGEDGNLRAVPNSNPSTP